MDEFLSASAKHIAAIIRSKEVSVVEVVKRHIERIEAVNPKLNAVVQLLADSALKQAREADTKISKKEVTGPLHGVPITIKDSLNTAGVVSTYGTEGCLNNIPAEDATVVARLREAGAILLGKTNTPEYTMAGETDNLVYGRTNNPYDISLSPGGSSGGAAAIIAAGGSPLDIGSDTGGSIRLPAHVCGIAGFKPTSGRVPRTGHIVSYAMGAMEPFTQNGPMARFVDDLILTLPIIVGVDWCDPAIVPMPLGDVESSDLKTLRVAFFTDNGIKTPLPEIVALVSKAAEYLSEIVFSVEEDCPQGIEESHDIFFGLLSAGGGAWVHRTMRETGTKELHPIMKLVEEALRADTRSAAKLDDLLVRADLYRSKMLGFLRNYDVLICPVGPYGPLPHDFTFNDEEAFTTSYSYTNTFNLTGWPAAVVRFGTSNTGMPLGIQVVGRPWQDHIVLSVAKQLETESGGWQPPPL